MSATDAPVDANPVDSEKDTLQPQPQPQPLSPSSSPVHVQSRKKAQRVKPVISSHFFLSHQRRGIARSRREEDARRQRQTSSLLHRAIGIVQDLSARVDALHQRMDDLADGKGKARFLSHALTVRPSAMRSHINNRNNNTTLSSFARTKPTALLENTPLLLDEKEKSDASDSDAASSVSDTAIAPAMTISSAKPPLLETLSHSAVRLFLEVLRTYRRLTRDEETPAQYFVAERVLFSLALLYREGRERIALWTEELLIQRLLAHVAAKSRSELDDRLALYRVVREEDIAEGPLSASIVSTVSLERLLEVNALFQFEVDAARAAGLRFSESAVVQRYVQNLRPLYRLQREVALARPDDLLDAMSLVTELWDWAQTPALPSFSAQHAHGHTQPSAGARADDWNAILEDTSLALSPFVSRVVEPVSERVPEMKSDLITRSPRDVVNRKDLAPSKLPSNTSSSVIAPLRVLHPQSISSAVNDTEEKASSSSFSEEKATASSVTIDLQANQTVSLRCDENVKLTFLIQQDGAPALLQISNPAAVHLTVDKVVTQL